MPDRVIRAINGPRGSVLLSGAAIAIVHAIAHFQSVADGSLRTGIGYLNTAPLPMAIAGALWAFTAVISIFGAYTHKGRQHDHADATGFMMQSFMLTLWGMTYFLGWALDGRGPITLFYGTIYLSVAVMIAASSRMTNKYWTKAKRRRERK